MEFLRTPDDRFEGLSGYPFAPHYVDVPAADRDALRMHYVDEGPREGRVLLLLHGEPTWSYLYRTMIPELVAAGFRTIAPDLIGFGRSDKPVHRSDYTYARHVAWLAALIEMLDLREMVLVCQDWGGLLGLRLLAEHEDRFAGAVVANTGLPTGDEPQREAFLRWREASQNMKSFSASFVLERTCTPSLAPDVVAGYDAPFPDESYVAGAREFPMLVPTRPDDPASDANRAAWNVLERFEKPMLCAFSDGDPITRGGERVFLRRVPGARAVAPVTIAGASHFLQEDRPAEFATAIVAFVREHIERS